MKEFTFTFTDKQTEIVTDCVLSRISDTADFILTTKRWGLDATEIKGRMEELQTILSILTDIEE